VGRADAVIFTRVDRGAPGADARALLARLAPRAPVFHARIRPTGLRDEHGAPIDVETLSPRRLLAVCGIANPAEFGATLAELGVAPEERLDFRDHQRYGPRQLARLRSAADRTGASLIVTTEKDAVKLAGRAPLPVVTVRLGVEVEESGFFALLSARLPARAESRP
jgi:tetraacyldisaccharide 4'-kinase